MYNMYHPFHVESGGGSECLIESIAVDQHDLFRLTQHIGMMSAHKCVAFFGQQSSVQEAIKCAINEPSFTLPEEADTTHRRYRLSVLIREDLLILFIPLNDEFLYQKTFDKETILVTLFRYLQDLSEVICLCPDDRIIAEFFPGPKNPFSTAAHSRTLFKLEEHSGIINCVDIETNLSFLVRELGTNFKQLVLNENSSRFFLHWKFQTFGNSELDSKTQLVVLAAQKLQELALEHKASKIQAVLSELDVELDANQLRTLVEYHDQYVRTMVRRKSTFCESIRAKLHSMSEDFFKVRGWLWRKSAKYSSTEKIDDRQFESAAGFISDVLMDVAIKETANGKDVRHIEQSTYNFCLERVFDFFRDHIEIRDHGTPEKLRSDVASLLSRTWFEHSIQCNDIRSSMSLFNRKASSLFGDYLQTLKPQTMLRLSPCAVNVIQDNDGKYRNLTFAPCAAIPTAIITPQDLEKLFDIKRRSSSAVDPKKLVERTRVVSSFPMHNGRSFLVLLSYEALHPSEKTQVLVVLSSAGVRKVQQFYLEDYLMTLGGDMRDVQSVTVVVICPKLNTGLVAEINESWKWREIRNFEFATPSGCGRLVCATRLPTTENIFILADSGKLYDLNTKTCSFEEMEIRENTDHGLIKKPLRDSKGNKYKCVLSLAVNKYFVLCNDHFVDVFDRNLRRVQSFKSCDNLGVKIFTDNINVYLSEVHETDINSHMFLGVGSDVALKSRGSAKKEALKGNPIVDIIYASILKYGPNSDFIGAPETSDCRFVLHRKNPDLERALESYLKTFATRFAVRPIHMDSLRGECSRAKENQHILSILHSRAPLHICTVEENNLVPLLDGSRQRITGELASISMTAGCITFSHLEKVLTELPVGNGIRVVSIIGRQSSGKSYLLNRLFGTRFSVSATRCTDGIWISYAHMVVGEDGVEQDFLVLDCEGLFSISRNEQEEVKLLTVLAAISDVTILNQDLNFNRYINRLFSNLNNAVDRVKGSNYFEGLLMMAVRDVSSEEGAKAAEEFERNIQIMNQRGEHKFLGRLFKGTMILQCLNNFEKREVFAEEIEHIRSTFVDFDFKNCGISDRHWIDGNSLIESLKVVLLQVHNDDEQSADEHIKKMRLANIENDTLSAWWQISKIGEFALREVHVTRTDKEGDFLFQETDDSEFALSQQDVASDVNSDEDNDNYLLMHSILRSKFFKPDESMFEKKWFNRRWLVFNDLFEEFVKQRLSCLNDYVDSQVTKLGQLLSSDERKAFLVGMKEKVEHLGINYSLCLQSCNECHLVCTKRKGHKEVTVDQKTALQKKLEEYADAAIYETQYETISEKQQRVDECLHIISNLEQERDMTVNYISLVDNLAKCKMELEASISERDGKKSELESLGVDNIEHETFLNSFREQFEGAVENWDLLCKELREFAKLGQSYPDLSSKTTDELLVLSLAGISEQFGPKCESQITQLPSAFEIVQELPKKWHEESVRNLTHIIGASEEQIASSVNMLRDSLNDDIIKLTAIDSVFAHIDTYLTSCSETLSSSKHTIDSLNDMVSSNKTELGKLMNVAAELSTNNDERERQKMELECAKRQIKVNTDNVGRHLRELQMKSERLVSEFGNNAEVDNKIKEMRRQAQSIENEKADLLAQHTLQIDRESDVSILENAIIEYLGETSTNDYYKVAEEMEWEVFSEPGVITSGGDTSEPIAELQELVKRQDLNRDRLQKKIKAIEHKLTKLKKFEDEGVDSDGETFDDERRAKIVKAIDELRVARSQIEADMSSTASEIQKLATRTSNPRESSSLSLSGITSTQSVGSSILSYYSRQFNDEQIRSLAKEIALIQNAISSCNATVDEYESLQRKFQHLESVLALNSMECYMTKLSVLQSETERLINGKTDLSRRLSLKHNAVKNKENKLQKYKEDGVDSDGEELGDKKRAELKGSIKKVYDDIADLECQLQELLQQENAVSTEMTELQEAMKKAADSEETQQMERELETLRATIGEQRQAYENNKTNLKTHELKMQELRQQLRLKFWNVEFKTHMQRLSEQESQLEQTLISIEKVRHEMENTQTELGHVTEQSNACDKEMNKLNSRLEDVTQAAEKCAQDSLSLNEKIENLQRVIRENEDDLKSTGARYESMSKFSAIIDSCEMIVQKYYQLAVLMINDVTPIYMKTVAFVKTRDLADAINKLETYIKDAEADVMKHTREIEPLRRERDKMGNIDEIQKKIDDKKHELYMKESELNRLQKGAKAQKEYNAIKAQLEVLETELLCSCSTDHKCDECCHICVDDTPPCKFQAGHIGDHLCTKEQHDCPHKCEICNEYSCMYALGHTNPANHKCSSTHQCKVSCKYCANTCAKSVTDNHTDHQCCEKLCAKRCIFCGNQCCEAHDHEDWAKMVDDPKTEDSDAEEVGLHLCGKQHQCPLTCKEDGVCEVQYVSEIRMWEHPLCRQEYEYIKPQMTRKQCAILIEANCSYHDEEHSCRNDHKCEVRCPECGSYCKLDVGHSGNHKTVTHRNKEYCYCVSRKPDALTKISESGTGKKARIYQPGDKFVLETCSQQCIRKGRAHYHLKECPGGSECAEIKYPGGAQHSTECFYPFCDNVYDKFLCSCFWTHYEWQMPYDDPSLSLCNSYCPHSSHDDDKKFCTLPAWHSNSILAKDHEFECHDFSKMTINGVDICFCIDTTGSMEQYIEQSKAAICRIMSEAVPKLSELGTDTSCLRFAVVGYKDHCDPVVVQNSSFVSHKQALSFLQTLSASGGGDTPEAVLDGLDAAAGLAWKTDNTKILFHICDSPPHGRKFWSGDDSYPDGCPCNRTEDVVLRKLRDKSVTYYVIPVTNLVNQMIDVFEKHIPVTRKTLGSSVTMDSTISSCVCKAIEDSELTATASGKM